MPQNLYPIQEEEIITEAEKRGYVFLNRDKSKITYRAQGQTFDFKNPKEKVRLEYYFDLIEKYKYPMNAIEFDVAISDDGQKQCVDIVVYTDANKKTAYIVVECKKDGTSDVEFERAVQQVFVKARILQARFAVCVAGRVRRVIEIKKRNKELPEQTIIADIPLAYGG